MEVKSFFINDQLGGASTRNALVGLGIETDIGLGVSGEMLATPTKSMLTQSSSGSKQIPSASSDGSIAINVDRFVTA